LAQLGATDICGEFQCVVQDRLGAAGRNLVQLGANGLKQAQPVAIKCFKPERMPSQNILT
jgi:hypothetical protein